jgi:outer membrane protein OmpA-like peptidoglycan-associated protein
LLLIDHAWAAESNLLSNLLKKAMPSPRMVAAATAVQSLPSRPEDFKLTTELPSVHFDFDKSSIRRADMRLLDANAEWLKTHPDYAVVIEGGADPRGARDYNLDLAERRAKAVKGYLVARGVAAERVTVLTAGDLKRACGEKGETCWSLDRRVDFLVRTLLTQAP